MNQFNKIICWYGFPDQLSAEVAESGFHSVLSETEKARNLRYRHDRDRRLHLLARLMVRSLLSGLEPEIRPAAWIFDQDIYGKPYISGPANGINRFHFNVSHTDGLVVVAISTCGIVGVDVENPSRATDYLGLAHRFFSAIESEQIRNGESARQVSEFFRIWTLKEAYVKAIGKGLAHGLDSFWFKRAASDSIDLEKSDLFLIDQASGESRNEDAWDCWTWQVGEEPGWVISVVAGRGSEARRNELEIRPFEIRKI
ncbi:MAG: 4'-phosphopantetheinyl transferase family protein [bacterium]